MPLTRRSLATYGSFHSSILSLKLSLPLQDDGTSGALQLTGTVAAGTPITAYWNQVWPHPYGPMVRNVTSPFCR